MEDKEIATNPRPDASHVGLNDLALAKRVHPEPYPDPFTIYGIDCEVHCYVYNWLSILRGWYNS